MAAVESLSRPFATDHLAPTSLPKSLSIMPTPPPPQPTESSHEAMNAPEPMDITPTSSMPPPASNGSPLSDKQTDSKANGNAPETTSPSGNGNVNGNPPAIGASTGGQPKVVQTAFIHKLYNMLEDENIQNLISWSTTNESFVMSPSTEFAKVLAQYFKHTNISSFVRQLNMYGFHKVSDVFHTGAPDSTYWEFKHGNGNFKRGDLTGLREIKRRASRHTLIHRDSFSTGSKSLAPTQSLVQPADAMPDPIETRLNIMEQHYYVLHDRFVRAEEQNHQLSSRYHMLYDGLLRCHQWNQDLATYLANLVPDQDSQTHRDLSLIQREINRQIDTLRDSEHDSHRPSFSAPSGPLPPYTPSHLHEPGPPLSPRQMPVSDLNQRRPSHPSIFELRAPQPPTFRPHIASHLSPRRYGSIGSNNSYGSPSAGRAPAPPPPPPTVTHNTPHPLATVSSPPNNLSRRHTSADIRVHNWEGNGAPGALPSGYPPSSDPAWPNSPARPSPVAEGDQDIRSALANYEISKGASSNAGGRHTPPHERPPLPPHDPISSIAGTGPESGWRVPGSRFPGYGNKGFEGSGGPPTRRSSMASNLQGLLNPAGDSTEDEDGAGPGKRKRVG